MIKISLFSSVKTRNANTDFQKQLEATLKVE